MNWLQRMMYGRYGVDQFSLFLIAVYLVLYFISLAKGRGSKKIRRRY